MPDLYPELTPAEVQEVIAPLAEPNRGRAALLEVPPTAVAPNAFGHGVEPHPFATACRRIAETVATDHWPTLDRRLLHDEEGLRHRLVDVLAADAAEMLVRPLVDGLRPVGGRADDVVYVEYCQDHLADGFARFGAGHPVAWGRLSRRLVNRVGALGEVLSRLSADHHHLVAQLDVPADARIADIEFAGDTHAGGRTVSIIRLDDATALVYKPRPVDCEAGYAQLVRDLRAELGIHLDAARVLRRPGYGYVEYLHAADDSAPDLDLRAVGILAAVMYALNARDMHFENIISTARGPVPVDLETLLHPARQKSTGTIETAHSGYHKLALSVFGTGILPMVVTREGREGYVDVGYLGGGEVHGSGPFRQFRVEHPFTARMRVTWAPEVAPSVAPSTVMDTAAAIVRSSCAEMVEGFTEAYRTISAQRTRFLAAVRRAFGHAEVRYVHNATVQYAQCLRILTAPTPSRSADVATGLVKRIGIASRGADRRLVDAECTQLWDTDVPYFLVGADQTTITDGTSARTPVAELPSTPVAQCDEKVQAMSEHDLITQVRLIRIAFNAKLPDPHTMAPATEVLGSATDPVAADRAPDTDADLRQLAGEIADGLVADMVEDRFPHLPATWIGPVATAVANRPWPPGVLGYDLYTGRVGPALTLAVLSDVLGVPAFGAASRRVFDPSAAILDARSHEARSIARSGNGAYSGFPGALWAMAHAGRHLGRPALTTTAVEALDLLGGRGPGAPDVGDGWFDLISGDVGAVLVRLALGDPGAADVAVAACEQALVGGIVHRLEQSGLAHGLAGLLHLAGRTHAAAGDGASARLAATVVHELDHVFAGPPGTLRTNRAGPRDHSDSWCNGVAGVLLATTTAARAGIVDPSRVAALVTGLAASLIATSTTLCHGALGLHEVLALAAPFAPAECEGLRTRLTRYLDADRLRAFLASPDSRYNQGPCLMVGRAGVGWHLATRLAQGLPSPLELTGLSVRG